MLLMLIVIFIIPLESSDQMFDSLFSGDSQEDVPASKNDEPKKKGVHFLLAAFKQLSLVFCIKMCFLFQLHPKSDNFFPKHSPRRKKLPLRSVLRKTLIQMKTFLIQNRQR